MKKIICIFLFLFSLSGCAKEDSVTKIETKVVEEKKTVCVEKQEQKNVDVALPIVGNNKLVVIDAGHQRYGNSEREPIGPGASQTKAKVTTGTTGCVTGNLESVINLEVAFKLQEKLQASGYQVIMVRTSQNVNISNSERAKVANDNKAGVFIRLHCNSDNNSSVSGTLTIAPSKSNSFCSNIAQSSQALSKAVVNNICKQTGSKNRGVMISDTMSGINWCQVPVTIVEMGFMSNPAEDRLLGDSSYQDKIVNGIVLGINEYLGH